jgi:hypothetical protein
MSPSNNKGKQRREIMKNNPLPRIKSILSTTAARWLSLTETIPNDLLTRSPAPNEWSALECLGHLLATEQWVFPVRARALLASLSIPPFDRDCSKSGKTGVK